MKMVSTVVWSIIGYFVCIGIAASVMKDYKLPRPLVVLGLIFAPIVIAGLVVFFVALLIAAIVEKGYKDIRQALSKQDAQQDEQDK
jgi:phosphate/sulfate permease